MLDSRKPIDLRNDNDSLNYVERYGLLMKDSSECTCDYNIRTNELYMSESFKTVFGIEPISVDQNAALYISHIHPDDFKLIVDTYKKTIPNSNELKINLQYRLRRGNGEYAYIQDNIIVLRDENQKAYRILNLIKDISSEHFYQAIEMIEREIMELSMRDDSNLKDIVTTYIQKIEKIFPNMKASVLRVKNNKILNLSSPSLPTEYIDSIEGNEIGMNRGSCGTAAFTKEKVIVSDIANDIRWVDYKDIALKYDFRACWSQPILNSQNEVVATFANYYQTTKNPDQWEAYAIERSQKLLSMIFSKFEYLEKIKNSNNKFSFVNELTNDAIYEWDIEAGTIVWGKSFKRIFGHPFEADVKYEISHWNELVHKEDYYRIEKQINQILKDKDIYHWEVDYRFLKSNNTYAYVKEMGHIIRDENGKAITIFGLLRDVSESVIASRIKQVQTDISIIFKEKTSLRDALYALLELILKNSDFKTAEIWVYSKDRKHINLISTYSKSAKFESYFEASKHIRQFKKGEGIPGKILEENKTLVWNNIQELPYFVRKHEAAKFNLKSAAGVPFNYKLNSVGVLLMSNDTTINNNDKALKILEQLKDFIGAEIMRKQEEEEMFLLFESSPDILAIASPDGHFTRANPAFCNLLGYTIEEIINTPFIEFIHPDDLKETQSTYEESISGEKKANNFINRYRAKNGSYRWISWNSSDIFGDEGYAFAYGRDITNIIELQNLLNAATSLSKVGGWELDLSTKNNGYLYWSKITKEIMGVDANYTPPLAEALDFYTDESKEKIKSALKELIDNNKEFDLELLCQFKDGSTKWVRSIGKSERINGECTKIYGSYQDIHNQKINEIAIKESEKRYADIFHLSPLPMWIIDVDNIKFLDVNNAALEQYGYTIDEFMKMNVGDLRPEADRDKVFNLLQNNKYYDKYENIGIWTHLKKNGEIIKVDIRSKNIKYKELNARIILASDVTERLNHLEALQAQNEKLKEIAWMQSHIVRAPLARIMGLVDMILDPSTGEKERSMAFDFFKTSANELDKIINDIVIKSQEISKF